jgi:hypothetical protein
MVCCWPIRGKHLHVPARPQDSDRIAALLQRHGVHDVGYFGPGTFEQFPLPDTG